MVKTNIYFWSEASKGVTRKDKYKERSVMVNVRNTWRHKQELEL